MMSSASRCAEVLIALLNMKVKVFGFLGGDQSGKLVQNPIIVCPFDR